MVWSAISGLAGKAATALGVGTAGWAAPVAGALLQNVSARQQAQKQMDFQRDMSDTSYQRAMADMRKAGLNPILAGKLGGASTPSGAMAPVQNIGAGVPAATQAASAVQLQREQAAFVNYQTRNEALRGQILALKDVPSAVVSGFSDRLASQIVKHLDDYVDVANKSSMFTNDQVLEAQALLSSLKATSLTTFKKTVAGLDSATLKVLEGYDWFKSLMESR